jgi:serine/threonine protein kinase
VTTSAISPLLRNSLSDRYTIDREIGAGGMATVYLATDLRHSRKVALKVLRPELTATLGPERFAQLGMADSMFARLSAAIATHDDVFMHVITMPAFARYQSDPRWDAIVGEVRRR